MTTYTALCILYLHPPPLAILMHSLTCIQLTWHHYSGDAPKGRYFLAIDNGNNTLEEMVQVSRKHPFSLGFIPCLSSLRQTTLHTYITLPPLSLPLSLLSPELMEMAFDTHLYASPPSHSPSLKPNYSFILRRYLTPSVCVCVYVCVCAGGERGDGDRSHSSEHRSVCWGGDGDGDGVSVTGSREDMFAHMPKLIPICLASRASAYHHPIRTHTYTLTALRIHTRIIVRLADTLSLFHTHTHILSCTCMHMHSLTHSLTHAPVQNLRSKS